MPTDRTPLNVCLALLLAALCWPALGSAQQASKPRSATKQPTQAARAQPTNAAQPTQAATATPAPSGPATPAPSAGPSTGTGTGAGGSAAPAGNAAGPKPKATDVKTPATPTPTATAQPPASQHPEDEAIVQQLELFMLMEMMKDYDLFYDDAGEKPHK